MFIVIWFFFVLEKLQSFCLIETSQSSKYCLVKDICILNHWLFVSTLKVSAIIDGICWNLWHQFVTSSHQCAYMCSLMQAIEMKLTELNWFFYSNLWQLQTVKNLVPCLFAANDKHLWITYHAVQLQQMPTDAATPKSV